MQILNILLIEDDEEDVEIFKSIVKSVARDQGYLLFVDVAANVSALETITDTSAPDVIISDFYLPNTTAEQFLPTLWAKQIPIIICTSLKHEEMKGIAPSIYQLIAEGTVQHCSKGDLTGGDMWQCILTAINK
jgi:CheY-like chemotaxis protein